MTFQEQIQQGIPSVLPKQNPTKQISITQNAKKSLKKKNWHYAMPLVF
jgi:hypothetical protein